MPRNSKNYGIIAQGFVLRNGQLHRRLGSAGVRHFDQRLSLFNMADQARAWAETEGHDAYQLQRCANGYASAKALGCMIVLNLAAIHAPKAED